MSKPSERCRRVIAQIAEKHLGLSTLEERGADRLDFQELSVASIRAALEAAYAAGAASAAAKAVRA
ncbi:MAG: hypothetical protein E6Q50_14445 [Lysobacter sp.]|jgi:hypothetical protein|nr:MAG: hypothetical protein E6Q50_14445 [Lysobacter sp.]